MATFYVHAPIEKLHYEMAWADVVDDGVTISTSTWTISPTGPTLSETGFDLLTSYLDVTGCTLGEDYVLKNKIVLSNGETYEASIFLFVEDK